MHEVLFGPSIVNITVLDWLQSADVTTIFVSYMSIYQLQLISAIVAVLINLGLLIYAFTCDCFNPYTLWFRMMLIIDIMLAMGYALDSISAYTHQWDMLTGADQDPAQALRMMAVRDCNVNRPYLWMLYVPKLWGSLNLLVLGMERILSVSYPLWFKAVRISYVSVFFLMLMLATMATGIGYSGATAVAPDETTHFSCESTWAFGEGFGWCLSFMVIAPIALGLYFNIYATMNCQKASNTFVFGKSRNKLYIEQRKSRKAAWLLWISLLGVGLPQAITVLGRLTLPLSLKRVQLLINLLFLAKCLANIFMYYHQMSKRYRGLFYVVKHYIANRRRKYGRKTMRRITPIETINMNTLSHRVHSQFQQQPPP